MTLIDVYQRYKHMDRVLTDASLITSLQGQLLFDCWAAIRETAIAQQAHAADRLTLAVCGCGTGADYRFDPACPHHSGLRAAALARLQSTEPAP